MERKTFFSVLGALLILQSAAAQKVVLDTVYLQLNLDSVGLDKVVVKDRRTPVANSRWSDMTPVDLITAGGAGGDLYKALQILPGTQVQGETGELLVRGGSSYETQTYTDDIHVLNSYTSNEINTPAHSRYSTFVFDGVNLASEGAPLGYREALSAVLPLETKDHSDINRLGVNFSSVGLGRRGMGTLDKGSLPIDLNYQNLKYYDKVYSGGLDFEKPYRLFAGVAQFRYAPGSATLLKVYAQYDRVDFPTYEGGKRHLFGLGEDNAHVSVTSCHRTTAGWDWLAGAAFSYYEEKINGAVLAGDDWLERQQELHLKLKTFKRFSSLLRFDVGLESYIRHYANHYLLPGIKDYNRMSPTISAGSFSATYYPMGQLKVELFFRMEYTSLSQEVSFSPRLALNYYWEDVVLSATIGRHTQLPGNNWLAHRHELLPEVCVQYNLGAQYSNERRLYKAELYYKDYAQLALEETVADTGTAVLTSGGYGHSKGIDLFFRDRSLPRSLEYQLSYTYDISRHKYQKYPELTTSQYTTRHNAAAMLKYTPSGLHSVVSLTNRFNSGRPYHNPALPGLINDEVEPYNSLDVGITYLASKKMIAHTSAANILARKNESRKIDNRAVLASSDHFFYVGVYITLGKKTAYDVSNF